ncbi:hypothetical protein C7477_10789 [Phyllobacterium leguminum]|uniref:Uncharacterized protein n=1 Tax=Phyllobacterium leguminum TaxID=314237 RepID=A0A318T5R1_9HYPH|nr:hypothetical protein C7477_10789 [Phyllobacterium leguminum]
MMWYPIPPITITLQIRKTRTGWTVTVRIIFVG